jgi:glycosyltransferase involved in cell wall biosynthesis
VSRVRKRVLFLIPSLVGGGAERVFTTLLRHLDRDHFEPQLAVLESGGAYTADVPQDVKIHDLRVQRVRYAMPSLIRLIWKVRPDTIVSTLGHLNVAISMLRYLLPPKTRVIVREAILVSSLLPAEVKNHRLWAWLYRHSYRQADMVVCLSDSMIADMVTNFGLPSGKMVRIYNPVDAEKVRAEAALEPNPYIGSGPHLVAAGRLSRQKGFDVLLDAMPSVLQALPNAQLTILGEGPLKGALEEQAQTLKLTGSVSFLGFQKNPWAYLKHASAFVLPSRYEGLPNIMLEALALGTPVVASNCPGAVAEVAAMTPEIAMVPMEDPRALAAAIISTCNATKRNSTAPQKSLGVFDVHRVVDEYSRIF